MARSLTPKYRSDSTKFTTVDALVLWCNMISCPVKGCQVEMIILLNVKKRFFLLLENF